MAAILSNVLGRPMRYAAIPKAFLQAQGGTMDRAFEFLEREGYAVGIHALRRNDPEVGRQDFETWARSLDWSLLMGNPEKEVSHHVQTVRRPHQNPAALP
ncbi:hypothetical protein [Archangium sp.]|uniref:hypothetical protein n=1 Tax=Archangium sp. TaxID=1872627 RepID=UPI00286B20A3|nr:hypothetical protein [Archangium sp.]